MEPGSHPTLGFIGIGTVGTALVEAFAQNGYRIVALFDRKPASSEALAKRLSSDVLDADSPQQVADQADVTFLTVSDDAIVSVADSVQWSARNGVVHCNGAASIDLLQRAQRQGAMVGALHPLQSFANVAQARKNIPGSAFAIEASTAEFEQVLHDMVDALGGTPLSLHGSKVLYHASAVMASNYLVTLLELASGLWEHLGISQAEGLKALLPLVRGTVENLEAIGLPAALTGPIARGDVGTVKRHVIALGEVAPELLSLYKQLARHTLPIALAKGTIDSEVVERLDAALKEPRGGNES
ncbi:DUF2520 domain-containing protein [Candidatus Bipolaricaulota bacterium]|nr:DUF2520 domain-containing protein [Candidatus Bipolaricaulota bacterium]